MGLPDGVSEPGGPLAGPRQGLSGGPGAEPPILGGAEPALSRQSLRLTPRFRDASAGKKASRTIRFRGIPKSCIACHQKAWTKALWRKSNPAASKYARRFVCHSWRHPGTCQSQRLFADFLRVRDGLIGKEDQSAYVVLTHDTGNPAIDKFDHWADLSGRWDKRLKSRLQRRWGKFQYAQTWESTRKGNAHLNLAVVTPRIRTWCQVEGCQHVTYRDCPNKERWCRNCGGRGKKGILCEGWSKQRKVLSAQAVAAGFGEIVWLSPVSSADKLASYLNKRTSSESTSLEITGSAIKGQLPIDAPARFRRIRFSAGWPKLPKQPKDEDWTGELVQKPLEHVEAEIQIEKERVERAHEDRLASKDAVAQGWAAHLQNFDKNLDSVSHEKMDFTCIPSPATLVLGRGQFAGREDQDGGDAPLSGLREECVAHQLRSGSEARTPDRQPGPQQQGREAFQVGQEEQVSGSGLPDHVARTSDCPSGPARRNP